MDLADVIVLSLEAKVQTEALAASAEGPNATMDVAVESDRHWRRVEDIVAFEVHSSVTGTIKSTDATGYSLVARHLLVYTVAEGREFRDEELDAFGAVSVMFTHWPYLRELVQSMTARAGLPPLTLGSMRSPI